MLTVSLGFCVAVLIPLDSLFLLERPTRNQRQRWEHHGARHSSEHTCTLATLWKTQARCLKVSWSRGLVKASACMVAKTDLGWSPLLALKSHRLPSRFAYVHSLSGDNGKSEQLPPFLRIQPLNVLRRSFAPRETEGRPQHCDISTYQDHDPDQGEYDVQTVVTG